MKKILLVTIILMGFANFAHSQYDKEQAPTQGAKSVYFELGGPGLASFNFDFRFGKRQDGLGGRVGFGGAYIDGSGAVFIPIGLNYLIGGKDGKNYFELGAGITPLIGSEDLSDDGEGAFTSTFGTYTFWISFTAQHFWFHIQGKYFAYLRKFRFFPLLRRSILWV
jgi:hypothetical protein